MKLHRLAVALAVAAPLLASAADAADPAAPVAPPEYRSVLPAAPTDLADAPVPWRQANQDVARFPRGHADIVRFEERRQREADPAAAPASSPEAGHGHAH